MSNEQMAKRLEEMAAIDDRLAEFHGEIEQGWLLQRTEALRAGAQALRTMDEIHAAAEKHAGHEIGLWPMAAKVMAYQLTAAIGEVERLREAVGIAEDTFRHYGVYHAARGSKDKAESNHALADRMAAALAGASAPDPSGARIAELEAALRQAQSDICSEYCGRHAHHSRCQAASAALKGAADATTRATD